MTPKHFPKHGVRFLCLDNVGMEPGASWPRVIPAKHWTTESAQKRMMTDNHSFNYKLRTMCHKCPRMCKTLQRGIFDFDLLSVQRSRPRSCRLSPAGRFPWRERDVGVRPVSEPRRRLHRGGRHAGPGGGAQLVEGDQPGEDWGSTEKLVSS